MEAFPAYILAGGRSTRFGSDKARAEVGGVPLIVRIARLAQRAGASSVVAVAREAGAYDGLGVKTIADLRPGLGPLSGLEAALAHAGSGWILLLTCDQLVCEKAWVDRLRQTSIGAAQAAVFHDGSRFQPVPGLYHASLLPQVAQLLDSGDRASFQRLLESANAARLLLPADWPEKLQANRPEDLP